MNLASVLHPEELKVRGKGRRPGNKKRNKQVVLYMDPDEWETVEWFIRFTKESGMPMTAGQILKAATVVGCLPLGPVFQLALLNHHPNSVEKFTDVLTATAQKASKVFGKIMMDWVDEEISKGK